VEREQISALAARLTNQVPSPGLDRRRAWRIIDWLVHVEAPVMLEVAGFQHLADAYRALPAISGPDQAPGVASTFRAAYRETDRASTEALRGCGPYEKRSLLRGPRPGPRPATGLPLAWAANETVPEVKRLTRDVPRPPALSKGLTAAGYASICTERDPRIPARRVARASAQLRAAGLELVQELIDMEPRAVARRAA
jgi:hypothetical protein